jgi:hypothetical protein
MAERETVLERIRKNLRMAESAEKLGNQHEAEAFAAMAQKMMLVHQVEMSDLEVANQDRNDPLGTEYFNIATAAGWRPFRQKKREQWLMTLVSAVCDAHTCKFWYVPNTKTIRIIGRGANRDAVKYVLTVLARESDKMADRHERVSRNEARKGGLPMPVEPKRAFLFGFADAIQDRLYQERERFKKEYRSAGTALVRIDTEAAAVTEFAAKLGGKAGSGLQRKVIDRASYAAGERAGKSANLSKGVGAGKGRTKGLLNG